MLLHYRKLTDLFFIQKTICEIFLTFNSNNDVHVIVYNFKQTIACIILAISYSISSVISISNVILCPMLFFLCAHRDPEQSSLTVLQPARQLSNILKY